MEKIMRYRYYFLDIYDTMKLSELKSVVDCAFEKFGGDVFVSIDCDDEFNAQIMYKELETDQEFAYRVSFEERKKEDRRKQYEELKKEFEG